MANTLLDPEEWPERYTDEEIQAMIARCPRLFHGRSFVEARADLHRLGRLLAGVYQERFQQEGQQTAEQADAWLRSQENHS